MYNQRKRSAFHEAGHAVVALVLGVELLSVTLDDTDGYGSTCYVEEATVPETFPMPVEVLAAIQNELTVLIAGAEGQKLYTYGTIDPEVTDDEERIREKVYLLIKHDINSHRTILPSVVETDLDELDEQLLDDLRHAYYQMYETRARVIVKLPSVWEGIHAVAARFQKGDALSGDEIREIVSKAVAASDAS